MTDWQRGPGAAADVGASTQDQALCRQLEDRLSACHTVEWDILATNGLDSPGLFKLLGSAAVGQFDVVILSIGANDATGLCSHSAGWRGKTSWPFGFRPFM